MIGIAATEVGATDSVPISQSTTCAEALPPTASQALTSDQIALLRTAYRNETEGNQPTAGAWLKNFQAWAAEGDARAQVQKLGQSIRSVGAHGLQNARAEARPTQINRYIRSQDKPARVRSAHQARHHKARASVRLAKNHVAHQRRAKIALAPDWFAYDAPARWSKRTYGWLY
jgi:predicted phage tail protein